MAKRRTARAAKPTSAVYLDEALADDDIVDALRRQCGVTLSPERSLIRAMRRPMSWRSNGVPDRVRKNHVPRPAGRTFW